jgi:hypothetical protein
MKEIDQPLKDKIMNLSDSELVKMAYIESIDYTDEAVQFAISEVRRRGLRELNIKHCPRCERPCDGEMAICQCGYNFKKPNIYQIEQVEKKRGRKNRIAGLSMILIAGFFLFRYWMTWKPPIPGDPSRHNYDDMFLGIVVFGILIGLWKLFLGSVVRNPTKSPFDALLGDGKREKGKGDDMEFFFCPSCGEQLLAELKRKRCPRCGNSVG